MTVQVKVCGITSLDEAQAMEGLGVRYFGFNFFPSSKRYITPDKAQEIIQHLSPVSIPIGLFVDEDINTLLSITRQTKVSMVQLHGSESETYISQMLLPVIKAVAVAPDTKALPSPVSGIRYLLFDTKTDKHFGGTGSCFNWNLLSTYKGVVPFFLAGGLGPENLEDALKASKPYAVDLNSRIEISPGKKDLKKLEQCMEIIKDFRL
ncbi:MAG: phosphoribosylanthranilate isomerase [Fibrobacteria bacterium]|nr:phosphoribosylanthranilate isomerase [Fibrobacteria bacterium]